MRPALNGRRPTGEDRQIVTRRLGGAQCCGGCHQKRRSQGKILNFYVRKTVGCQTGRALARVGPNTITSTFTSAPCPNTFRSIKTHRHAPTNLFRRTHVKPSAAAKLLPELGKNGLAALLARRWGHGLSPKGSPTSPNGDQSPNSKGPSPNDDYSDLAPLLSILIAAKLTKIPTTSTSSGR